MDIRAPRPGDTSVLCALVEQLGYCVPPAELARRIRLVSSSEGHLVRVADMDGRVVGFIHAVERLSLEKGNEAVVQAVAVDGARRRVGIGARLMREAESWAAARGLRSIALHTRTDRTDAHAFYVRNGYEPVAVASLMRKALTLSKGEEFA